MLLEDCKTTSILMIVQVMKRCHLYYRHPKPHRFEQLWAQDQDSNKIVKKAWYSTNGDSALKLKYTMDQMTDWGKSKFGNIPIKIKHLQTYLGSLRNAIPNHTTMLKIRKTEAELDDLLHQEELWWSQRAKVHWLQYGDLNTKYFHHKANTRKRKNFIHNIHVSDGNNWKDSNNS